MDGSDLGRVALGVGLLHEIIPSPLTRIYPFQTFIFLSSSPRLFFFLTSLSFPGLVSGLGKSRQISQLGGAERSTPRLRLVCWDLTWNPSPPSHPSPPWPQSPVTSSLILRPMGFFFLLFSSAHYILSRDLVTLEVQIPGGL